MKCEKCNEKEATVFFEQSVNGESKSMHLCPECAAKVKKEGFFEDPFSFSGNLFGSLFGLGTPQRTGTKRCGSCGATWADMRREGKALCPECYRTFSEELEPTLRSLHGKVSHNGRTPAGRRVIKEKEEKLAALKSELAAAISAEEYEKAAVLRDRIKATEKEGV